MGAGSPIVIGVSNGTVVVGAGSPIVIGASNGTVVVAVPDVPAMLESRSSGKEKVG